MEKSKNNQQQGIGNLKLAIETVQEKCPICSKNHGID